MQDVSKVHQAKAAEAPPLAGREHDSHAPFQEAVDPGYWPRAHAFRATIAICYVVLVPLGLLPMSTTWWALSGGALVLNSIAMYGMYRFCAGTKPYESISPWTDTAVVTLAIIALAKPEYPIWMGYFLILPSLANFHSSRWVMGFSLWVLLNCWAAFIILSAFGRADVNWGLATVVSILGVFTAVNSDIIAQSNRKLRMLVQQASLTDPLTGLGNRRLFRQVLDAHGIGHPAPLAVLMYDLDDFKLINDERGHLHADGVLVDVADQLRACFRDADVVARYGGDEMIVLAHVATLDEAATIAQRSLEQVLRYAGVAMSVGVSVYPLTASSLDAAVQSADEALAAAKRGGKARMSLAETAA